MGVCCSQQTNPNKAHIDNIEEVLSPNVHNMEDVLKQYKFGRTLGTGASCRVCIATNKEDPNDAVAIKIMDKSAKNKRLYKREVDVLSALTPDITKPARGILSFICHGEDSTSYYIVTRLLTGGELFDRILSDDDRYKITEKVAIKLCKDMLERLKHCHDQGIIHSDLKPENFVFVDDSPDADIVLIDFGSASIVEDDEIVERVSGTAYYLAPELAAAALENRRKNGAQVNPNVPNAKPRTGKILKASDVYSMGIITHVMMTGRAPFFGDDDQGIYEATCIRPLTFPDTDARDHHRLNLTDLFKDFMRRSLEKDPLKRITLEEAIHHPWVNGHDATDVKLNQTAMTYLKQFTYETKLKQEITRVLAQSAAGVSAESILAHFNRLDSSGDGFLDLEELTVLLLDLGYAGSQAKVEARNMIKSADENHDGVIDFPEFKQVYFRRVLSTNEQYIHRVFNVFDTNHDGTIDSDELKMMLFPQGLKAARGNRPEAQSLMVPDDQFSATKSPTMRTVEKMITEVDANGDGVIDFEEFKTAMHEQIEAGTIKFNEVPCIQRLETDISSGVQAAHASDI